jgi:hypothetical protein
MKCRRILHMKKFAVMVIALVLLTGYALADIGVPPVTESQGIVTSTTIDAVGNFASTSEIQWRIASGDSILDIPDLDDGETIYESTYTEDTTSNGLGLILYDKELDIETSGQITGQYNIEAAKLLEFIGVDGARVVSSDNIFVDGAAAEDTETDEAVICPFAEEVTHDIPAYCNRVEAGSTIDMTVANVRTTSNDRFVMPAGDSGVELNHDIVVTELVEDLPSMGTASAFMDVLIQEGGAGHEASDELMERIEFTEETTVTGDISTFQKLMHYESSMVR